MARRHQAMAAPNRESSRAATDDGHAPRRNWLPWAVLAFTLGLSFVWKSRCLDQSGWSDAIQYRLYCYSDITALWYTRGFAGGLIPYVDEVLEYPTLIGAQIGVLAALARAVAGDIGWFFSLNAVVHAVAAGGILVLLGRNAGSRLPVMWWAAAPPLALYAFHNWDLPALALLVWAVTLHREERDIAAGVAAGLGASAKLLPVLVVPLFIIARLRQRRPREAIGTAVAAAGAWGVANVPVAIAAPEAWGHFFEFSSERGPTAATVWAFLHLSNLFEADIALINGLSALAFVAGGAVIVLIGIRRYPPPSTWMLLLPVLAWFLVTNKVYSPQFDLWLVPLLILAGRRAPLAALFATDAFVLFAELSFLGDRVSYPVLAVGLLARAAILGWIVVEALRPDPTVEVTTRSRTTSASPPPRWGAGFRTRSGRSR